MNATTTEFETRYSFVYGGVEPQMGFVDTEFVYQIRYYDADNNPLAKGIRGFTSILTAMAIRWTRQPISARAASPMTETDPNDTNYVDGKVYEYGHGCRWGIWPGIDLRLRITAVNWPMASPG